MHAAWCAVIAINQLVSRTLGTFAGEPQPGLIAQLIINIFATCLCYDSAISRRFFSFYPEPLCHVF